MCRIVYKYLPRLRKEQGWSGTLQKHCTFLFHLVPQLFQAPDGLLKLLLTPQFSSVAQSCLTLCDPMDCSTPGFLVHHHLPEFTQSHVHWVGDAIQPSHPLQNQKAKDRLYHTRTLIFLLLVDFLKIAKCRIRLGSSQSKYSCLLFDEQLNFI